MSLHKPRSLATSTGHSVSRQANFSVVFLSRPIMSLNDVTIIPTVQFLVARICTPPGEKCHVLVRQTTRKKEKERERKIDIKIFFIFLSLSGHSVDCTKKEKKTLWYTLKTFLTYIAFLYKNGKHSPIFHWVLLLHRDQMIVQ